MISIKIFHMPKAMEATFPCIVCGKYGCELLAQLNTFGGGSGGIHQKCYDEIDESEQDQSDHDNQETE